MFFSDKTNPISSIIIMIHENLGFGGKEYMFDHEFSDFEVLLEMRFERNSHPRDANFPSHSAKTEVHEKSVSLCGGKMFLSVRYQKYIVLSTSLTFHSYKLICKVAFLICHHLAFHKNTHLTEDTIPSSNLYPTEFGNLKFANEQHIFKSMV